MNLCRFDSNYRGDLADELQQNFNVLLEEKEEFLHKRLVPRSFSNLIVFSFLLSNYAKLDQLVTNYSLSGVL